MPKKKETKTKKVVNKTTTKTSKKASVYNGKVLVREYTTKIHGKDFNKLAEQFANKHNYNVK